MIDSIMKIDEFGAKRWRNKKGLVHRKNGPAVIYLDGEMFWLINNKSHRIDGPASVCNDGYKSWYIKDQFIRKFEYD